MAKVKTQLSDYTQSDLKTVAISDIATIIRKDWVKTKGSVNYAAKPYLDAMLRMNKITDNYGADDGKSIVLYFLCNASTWQGTVAKTIKLHLNKLAK